ncbi:MAG TPA: hypothetical protein PKX41_09255 [Anaerolineaceae bacterium]|nr:hypothetical protein [Anaerolineaceae bacterium]
MIDTLSAKFFVGLAADQPAPDHSTLTPSDTPVPSDTPTPSETPTPTETATETATANSTSAPTATATAVPIPGEAQYVYDGDGNMIKSVIGDVTTYYAGSTYEKKVVGIERVERKYYFAGSSRIARRENGALTWLLFDNQGSTTAAADGRLFDFHRLGFENGDEFIRGGTAKDAGLVTTHLVGEVVLADQVDNSSFDFERGEFVWQAVNKDFDAGFQSFGANILDGLNFFGF